MTEGVKPTARCEAEFKRMVETYGELVEADIECLDTDYDKLLVLFYQWHYDDPGIQSELETFDYAYRLAARLQAVLKVTHHD